MFNFLRRWFAPKPRPQLRKPPRTIRLNGEIIIIPGWARTATVNAMSELGRTSGLAPSIGASSMDTARS